MSFTDPGVDLQRAIVTALLNDPAVSDIAGRGVYDRVPRDLTTGDPNVPFPFVTLGEFQTLPELAECTDAADSFVTLHTWSRKVGSVEAKNLNKAVAAALHDRPLTLSSGTLQSLLLQESRIINDPDGLTTHGVLTFHSLTDAN
jgi:Protein of unknown function (DUF3168)